jgi:hypothetical protein
VTSATLLLNGFPVAIELMDTWSLYDLRWSCPLASTKS